jgi:hypothetical protein
MLQIRKADKDDEASILNLWKQLIDYHRSIEAFRPSVGNVLPRKSSGHYWLLLGSSRKPELLSLQRRKAESWGSSTPDSRRPAIVPPI